MTLTSNPAISEALKIGPHIAAFDDQTKLSIYADVEAIKNADHMAFDGYNKNLEASASRAEERLRKRGLDSKGQQI